MKRTLTALAAMAFMAGAAHAQLSADTDTLEYHLNGTIASVCSMTPNGISNVSVDMNNYGNQGLAAVAYSCNSPYTLTIKSLHGGLSHFESGDSFVVEYDVETFGFFNDVGNGSQSFNSVAIKNTPATVASVNSWQNILFNIGLQTGNLDLILPSADKIGVAGTYKDTLTLTLTADL